MKNPKDTEGAMSHPQPFVQRLDVRLHPGRGEAAPRCSASKYSAASLRSSPKATGTKSVMNQQLQRKAQTAEACSRVTGQRMPRSNVSNAEEEVGTHSLVILDCMREWIEYPTESRVSPTPIAKSSPATHTTVLKREIKQKKKGSPKQTVVDTHTHPGELFLYAAIRACLPSFVSRVDPPSLLSHLSVPPSLSSYQHWLENLCGGKGSNGWEVLLPSPYGQYPHVPKLCFVS